MSSNDLSDINTRPPAEEEEEHPVAEDRTTAQQPPSPTPSMAKSVGAASSGRGRGKKKVRTMSSVADAIFASSLERRGDVFLAPFVGGPLTILTPTVTIKTSISDDDETQEYADLRLKMSACDIMRRLEEDLLSKAKAAKDAWFQNPDLDDAFLDNSFKRFVDDGRLITVRLDDVLDIPDGGVPSGTKAKVVVECEGAIFTRTQFGVLWSLKMIKSIDKDQYLFDPEETSGLAAGDIVSCVSEMG
jgi:hypothetical protein